jgi:hypothetical protein
VLLMIVRHGATDSYRRLRETFAGEPVHIMWEPDSNPGPETPAGPDGSRPLAAPSP